MNSLTEFSGMMVESIISDIYLASHDDYFYEDANQSGNNFLKSAMDKLTKLFSTVREKITSVFAKKNEQIDSAVAAIQSSPELMQQKVETIDYDRLKKLNQDTIMEIETTKNLRETMEKYKKQRNRLLAAEAITAISLGKLCMWIKGRGEKSCKELKENEKEYKKKIHQLEKQLENRKEANVAKNKEINRLEKENEYLHARSDAQRVGVKARQGFNDVKKGAEVIGAGIEGSADKLSAVFTIIGDGIRDQQQRIAEGIEAVTNSKTKIGKVINGGKALNNVKNGAPSKRSLINNRIDDINKGLEKIDRRISSAEKELNSPSTSKERKKKCQSFINAANKEKEKLEGQKRSLNKIR